MTLAPRRVRFSFAKGVGSEELELRLGYLVVKHRAHGVVGGELATFLLADVAEEGLLVADTPGDTDEIVFHVRRP